MKYLKKIQSQDEIDSTLEYGVVYYNENDDEVIIKKTKDTRTFHLRFAVEPYRTWNTTSYIGIIEIGDNNHFYANNEIDELLKTINDVRVLDGCEWDDNYSVIANSLDDVEQGGSTGFYLLDCAKIDLNSWRCQIDIEFNSDILSNPYYSYIVSPIDVIYFSGTINDFIKTNIHCTKTPLQVVTQEKDGIGNYDVYNDGTYEATAFE